MCKAMGLRVHRLVRTKIGPISDLRLPAGEWRPLEPREVRELYAAGLRTPDGPDDGAIDGAGDPADEHASDPAVDRAGDPDTPH